MHYKKEVVRRFLVDLERQTPTSIDNLLGPGVQEELHLQETEFEDFVTSDYDLAVCGELTDADIITSVLPVTNAEADKDEEEGGEIDKQNFTIKNDYNAVNIIKSVFLKKGSSSDDVVKSITKLD
ncbi:hypothetical protein HHI36_018807 [Cryptolaemus montrouzieri]|uniref:Uncharacterized protein n=1 Tax=Cryptolaemus montrouzieri TaxID=559131 RepID=A0ABD2P125_9CUCU